MKKEVIIRFEDSRVLELLRGLSSYLGFTISEKKVGIVKKPGSRKRGHSAVDFVNKWAGFLKNADTDDSRYDYLVRKYK